LKREKIEEKEWSLQQTDQANCYQYGDYTVELEFSLDGPTFSEAVWQYMESKQLFSDQWEKNWNEKRKTKEDA